MPETRTEAKLLKADDEQRVAWFTVGQYERPDGSVLYDLQADGIDEREVVAMAGRWLRDSRAVDVQHDGQPTGVEVWASAPLPRDVQKELGIDPPRPLMWVVAYHFPESEEDLWQRVKGGEFGALSIGGNAEDREDVA